MIQRLTLSFLTVSAMALACLSIYARQSAEVQLATRMSGEYWYAIRSADRQVGYFHSSAGFEADGDWFYRSRTHILMQASDPLSVDKYLRFDASPPNQLIEARYQTRRGGVVTDRVDLHQSQSAEGHSRLSARIGENDETPVSWQYTLADYLAVELKLAEERPAPGEELRVKTLDLENVSINMKSYELVQEDPLTLKRDAPMAPTSMVLDEHFIPTDIHVSGVFHFQRVSFEEALAPANPAFKAAYKIPLAEPLTNISSILSMTLTVEGTDLELRTQRGATSGLPSGTYATANLPTHDEAFMRLAAKLDDNPANTESRLNDLVSLVHHAMVYRPGEVHTDLAGALQRGYGECTEFADLLTTLASIRGWEARTVFGLAYDPSGTPGFGMHAWNEVRFDGRWHAVDATWNQTVADATHIYLDDETMARLKFLQGSDGLLVRVKQIHYD